MLLILHVAQVISIKDIVPPPQREAFDDVYIALELMDTDLHQIIRSNQALSEQHCQVCSFTNSTIYYLEKIRGNIISILILRYG
jgi:hypothetical protein